MKIPWGCCLWPWRMLIGGGCWQGLSRLHRRPVRRQEGGAAARGHAGPEPPIAIRFERLCESGKWRDTGRKHGGSGRNRLRGREVQFQAFAGDEFVRAPDDATSRNRTILSLFILRKRISRGQTAPDVKMAETDSKGQKLSSRR